MRALVTSEIAEVSGGLNPCPPCPPGGCPIGEEVTVTGRRPSTSSPVNPFMSVITDPVEIRSFLDTLAQDGGGWRGGGSWIFFAGGGGGGGGDSSGLGDTVIGYPVDLNSSKDSVDYEKEWKAVFDKMSPAELKAFDRALENEFQKAMNSLNFGLAEKLSGFKDANGSAAKMGMASSYAAQNMSQANLVLLEVAITRAYSVAAALPGGI